MLYAILIYGDEGTVEAWSAPEEAAVMDRHYALREELAAEKKLGPAFRLMPTTSAVTVRSGRKPVVLDGPFTETKEQLLGLYVIDGELDDAIAAARRLGFETGAFEIRPVRTFIPADTTT